MPNFLFALPFVALAGCSSLTANVAKGCADLAALQSTAAVVETLLGPNAPAVVSANAVLNASCADAPQVAALIAQLQAAAKTKK